jgi:predicted nucleotidyltransferase component of viral defense system
MGQVEFTPTQKLIFDTLASDKHLTELFYLTGGTALSVFYLHHRLSDDLDFFSEKNFENETVIALIKEVSSVLSLSYRFTQRESTRTFELVKDNQFLTKVDFAYYPHKRLEPGKKVQNIAIDSLKDIGANKLLAVNQRVEVKDFVDLYFLLQKFTVWDLIYGVERKFRLELDLVLLGSDFLKVESFDFLPKMVTPLTLKELKEFFKKEALKLGKRIVKT